MHYSAKADETWGEHEMDYVLICRKDIDLTNVNKDEIQKTIFVTQAELKTFVKNSDQNNIQITPWFSFIMDKFLFKWWDNLDTLDKFKDDIIHRAGNQSKYL